MRPSRGLATPDWRARGSQVICDLKSYLMAR
jgi:hypothetical protein